MFGVRCRSWSGRRRRAIPCRSHRLLTPAPVPTSTAVFASSILANIASVAPTAGVTGWAPRSSARSRAAVKISSSETTSSTWRSICSAWVTLMRLSGGSDCRCKARSHQDSQESLRLLIWRAHRDEKRCIHRRIEDRTAVSISTKLIFSQLGDREQITASAGSPEYRASRDSDNAVIELRDPEQEDQLIYQVNDEPRPRESEVLTTESAVDSELIGTAVFDATGEKSSMPSWDELVRQHGDRVYRLAYRLSGDAQDAEGLDAGHLHPGVSLALRLSARNFRGLVAPHHHKPVPRHGSPTQSHPYGSAARRTTTAFPRPVRTPSRSTTTRASTQVCRPHWTRLAPEFRAAVVLCDIEGLSYEEIGATLGVKLGTVRKPYPSWATGDS